MRTSLTARKLVCQLTNVNDPLTALFILPLLANTASFRHVHLHNFNLADDGETFTKAVGLGLKTC